MPERDNQNAARPESPSPGSSRILQKEPAHDTAPLPAAASLQNYQTMSPAGLRKLAREGDHNAAQTLGYRIAVGQVGLAAPGEAIDAEYAGEGIEWLEFAFWSGNRNAGLGILGACGQEFKNTGSLPALLEAGAWVNVLANVTDWPEARELAEQLNNADSEAAKSFVARAKEILEKHEKRVN